MPRSERPAADPRPAPAAAASPRRADPVPLPRRLLASARRLAGRAARSVYERLELVFIDLELASWAPRLARRTRGVQVEEVTLDSLPRWLYLLDASERELFDRELGLGSRLFIAVNDDRLGGVVGVNRRHHDPRWNVTCEVGPDETIIFRVMVTPEFRRGATGGVLVETVLQKLKDEGIRRVVGVIHHKNRQSLILAENLGLQQYLKQRIHRFFSKLQTAPRVIEGRKKTFSERQRGRAR